VCGQILLEFRPPFRFAKQFFYRSVMSQAQGEVGAGLIMLRP
jgi:hypothetical protein